MQSESFHKWAHTLGSIGTFAGSVVAVAVSGYAALTAQGKADAPAKPKDPVVIGSEGTESQSNGSPLPAGSGFGKWESVKGPQKAETDGFARVISGGNNPARGVQIQVKENDDWKTVARSPGVYSTAITPIAKGATWRGVAMEGGGQLSIAWMSAQ